MQCELISTMRLKSEHDKHRNSHNSAISNYNKPMIKQIPNRLNHKWQNQIQHLNNYHYPQKTQLSSGNNLKQCKQAYAKFSLSVSNALTFRVNKLT